MIAQIALSMVVVAGFSSPSYRSSTRSSYWNREDTHIIVVGKIILDVYGDPTIRDGVDDPKVTIGGGGPQAAWGACAALAARDLMRRRVSEIDESMVDAVSSSPPKQSVTFMAPIGLRNWIPSMTNELQYILPMLHSNPILLASECHITPTIQIWHDSSEVVRWMPVNGSFGEEGAGGLWKDRPNAEDILNVITSLGRESVAFHAILESGHNATGDGLDALPFFSPSLMKRVSVASIEPIVFPDNIGVISSEDISKVSSLIERIEASLVASSEMEHCSKLLIVSPDRPCYSALVSFSSEYANGKEMICAQGIEFAVRDGSNGSQVNGLAVPPASLKTVDGKPLNPTGAGNAYSGAYVACRSTGSSVEEAASLANAVGAVVCEYENLPSWTWQVLDRIVEAAIEVSSKIGT